MYNKPVLIPNHTTLRNGYLHSQFEVSQGAEGWRKIVYEEIKDNIGDKIGFPCIFAKNAFKKKLLRFIFVENIAEKDLIDLATGLRKFVNISKDWDGSLKTAYPLVIVFSRSLIAASTVGDYHSFGWKILQKLHFLDPKPWPVDISREVEASGWSMCFNGMPLFFNMSHPAHKRRKSRNLGLHFKFIVNPRERFDVVAGNNKYGNSVRKNIRKRIEEFDGYEHCKQLGHFASNSLEWQQYGIIEENQERLDKCPLSTLNKKGA